MNTFRTGLLLAGLTGLFLAIGYLMGGQSGMIVSLPVRGRHQSICLLERR